SHARRGGGRRRGRRAAPRASAATTSSDGELRGMRSGRCVDGRGACARRPCGALDPGRITLGSTASARVERYGSLTEERPPVTLGPCHAGTKRGTIWRLKVTIDDPKAYTKPWTATLHQVLVPDTNLLDYYCQDNEKDNAHVK